MDYRKDCISVVIPTYNYGHYIGAALESVLTQTLKPLEIIVIDDGSTDGTETIVRIYQNGPLPVRYIAQPNSGVSAARNHGIRLAHGEWTAFLDADDSWNAEKLELQMRCARELPHLALIGALHAESRLRDARTSGGPLFTVFDLRDLLGVSLIGTSAALARTSLLVQSGLFDTRKRFAEDREMWLKLSRLGGVARVNARLWNHRAHPQQASADHLGCSRLYGQVLEEFFGAHPELRRRYYGYARAYFHYDAALSHRASGHGGRAFYHAALALLRHPFPMLQPHAEKSANRAALLAKCALPAGCFEQLMAWRRKLSRHANNAVKKHAIESKSL